MCKINVGMSRKLSENYQSQGFSINVEAEVDQTLLRDPAEFQKKIRYLFNVANTSINQQMAEAKAALKQIASDAPGPQQEGRPANGQRFNNAPRFRGGKNGNRVGPATDKQHAAIKAIGYRTGLDLEDECRQLLGVGIEALTSKQASQLIEHLDALQPNEG